MAENKGMRAKIQRFGSYLSGMIMPNIGAFIAWGIITALFIEDGWWPNATIATLVTPMITYLLPLLIGFTGGRMIYDLRGVRSSWWCSWCHGNHGCHCRCRYTDVLRCHGHGAFSRIFNEKN
ncbi:hypothetical protein [Oceanobacillus caeni]|uniref:hypothetical protein n=1 Tax=Oceanobacillus caeni TaxID=405946 RepID=UPI00399D0661